MDTIGEGDETKGRKPMGYHVRISDGAPITQALAMRLNQMEADISSAAPTVQRDTALNEIYKFLSALVQAVHQLETGELPEVSRPTEADE